MNLSNKGVGFANCAPSTRYIKINLRVISTTEYLYKPARASQDHPTIYPVFTLNIIFSKKISPICNYWIEQSWYIYTQFKKHFKKSILQFIRPSPSSTYNSFSNKGIKHVTRLRLGLSHLRDHKFKHGFLDSLNLICICGLEVETTCHYSIAPILQMKDLSSWTLFQQ